jgi:hypothetical protein
MYVFVNYRQQQVQMQILVQTTTLQEAILMGAQQTIHMWEQGKCLQELAQMWAQ